MLLETQFTLLRAWKTGVRKRPIIFYRKQIWQPWLQCFPDLWFGKALDAFSRVTERPFCGFSQTCRDWVSPAIRASFSGTTIRGFSRVSASRFIAIWPNVPVPFRTRLLFFFFLCVCVAHTRTKTEIIEFLTRFRLFRENRTRSGTRIKTSLELQRFTRKLNFLLYLEIIKIWKKCNYNVYFLLKMSIWK